MKAEISNVLTFLRVVDLGSFTKAAKSLGHPTSTVSRRIARLEDELGVRLLARTTRRLNLTDVGRVYFERVTHGVAVLEDAEHEVAESRGTPRGLVRLVAPAETHLGQRQFLGFLIDNPEVRLDVHLTNSRVNLSEENFDVGIVPGPLADSSSLIGQRLFESPFRLVASPDYLEHRGVPRSATQLSQHDGIVFSSRSAGASWALRVDGQDLQVPIKARLAVDRIEAAREAALAGLGIALLPLLACRREIQQGRLVTILDELAPPPTTMWLVYAGGRHLAPAVRALVDHIKESYRSTFDS